MQKKKVYAVAHGVQPGIYETWDEAEKQVKGFAGALFKGFTDRAAAHAWLKSPTYQKSPSPSPRRPAEPVEATEAADSEGDIHIYSDGGCLNNPGPGGYGCIVTINGHEQELTGGFRLTTNNRMELMACIAGLRLLQQMEQAQGQAVAVYSDSRYVVNGISKGWAQGWQRQGWIKSDKKPAANPDLWGELLALVARQTVRFHWVKGHAGHPLNERCDRLAVSAARGKDLPEDTGFRVE